MQVDIHKKLNIWHSRVPSFTQMLAFKINFFLVSSFIVNFEHSRLKEIKSELRFLYRVCGVQDV